MDFSSVSRALDSLGRRNPPLHESIVTQAQKLSKCIHVSSVSSSTLSAATKTTSGSGAGSDGDTFLSGVVFLITTSQTIYSIKSNNKEEETHSSKSNDENSGDVKESMLHGEEMNEHANVDECGDVMTLSSGSAVVNEKTTSVRWEPLAVGLYIATELLNQQQQQQQQRQRLCDSVDNNSTGNSDVYVDGPRVPSMVPSEAIEPTRMPTLTIEQIMTLCNTLHAASMENLEHREPRVRTLVAKAIGAYAKISPGNIADDSNCTYDTIYNDFFNANNEHVRTMHTRLKKSIHDHIVSGRDEHGNYSRSSEGAVDDTTGWRALETNWLALSSMISALAGRYLDEFGVDLDVMQDCEFSSVNHVNRHVRAAGIACLEQMIHACLATARQGDTHGYVKQLLTDPSSKSAIIRTTTLSVCRAGLADNWSQVRMAASVLCRVFLVALNELDSPPDDVYPVLLPRMCLNRFYLAQGVKLYSHETWKIVFTSSAVPKIAENLPAVCRYYVKMCDADNHAVREAACQAIAELAVRLGDHSEYREALKGSIEMLLQALLMCFHDESWPVRDEACLACGIICKSFPEECRPQLNLLWDRWSEQLTDQIWSVREDAGVALGDAIEAYGPEFMTKIRELIKRILPAAKEQAPMTREEYRAHSNDIQAHTDSQLYSCGSLAPKLRKGGAGRIGCSSCGIDRPKAPWEATDGCIYLIREICRKCCPPPDGSKPLRDDILLSDDELMPLLKELADVCRVQHFPQSDDLRATLWRNLPAMAHYIGKDRFKRHYLDIFMDLLFATLESRSASQLSRHAAGQCAEELASLVGTSIFRGRLEDYQRELFDQTMRERQMMPKGPDNSFSPFGPTGLLDVIQPKV